jgi:hypothetical protein
MTRLTSAQIISLNILNNEISGDDSCDESEIDNVESHFTASSDDESIDNGVDDGDINDDEMVFRVPNLIQSNVSNVMSKSNTIEMISSNIQSLNKSIHGRVNKNITQPFEWYEYPTKTFQNDPIQHACVIPSLQDIKSIERFFQMLISVEMVNKIANFTNKKISLINNTGLDNESYRLQRNRLESVKVTTEEIYAFIGLLLLLGITKKSDVSIESLWKADSLNYTPFAVATMSRDRFQLL